MSAADDRDRDALLGAEQRRDDVAGRRRIALGVAGAGVGLLAVLGFVAARPRDGVDVEGLVAEYDCGWISHDNCQNMDGAACHCRAVHGGPCAHKCPDVLAHAHLWEGEGCAWIMNDNCQRTDETSCRCRELNPHSKCTPCPNSAQRTWQGGSFCSWLWLDNCENFDEEACGCRALNPHGRCPLCTSSRESRWSGGESCEWLARDNCKSDDDNACYCRSINPDGPCPPCRNGQRQDGVSIGLRARWPSPEVSPPAPSPSDVFKPLAPLPPLPATGWAPPLEGQGSSSTLGARRKASFLAIGDWGFDADSHGNIPTTACQRLVADKMLEKWNELQDVRFVVNVGDSFYPNGLHSKFDPQWQHKWRDMYSEQLRSIPWYSVYGNHDLHHDPCMCTDDLSACAQVNANISNLDYFYMPDVNWHREHPDLNLEVVGLDLNHYMDMWNDKASPGFSDCRWTQCKDGCLRRSERRAREALDHLQRRLRDSVSKNMLVFSHYPTDYLKRVDGALEALSDNSKHNIFYLGGHRHNIDNTTTASIAPNVNWLVGGGGGWSCDGPDQGFLVGEIAEDDSLTLYPVIVERSVCCR